MSCTESRDGYYGGEDLVVGVLELFPKGEFSELAGDGDGV